MTFDAALIFSLQKMGFQFGGQRLFVFKQPKNFNKLQKFRRLILIPFKVLFITGTKNYSIDFIIASTLLVSTIPAYSPLRTSSIAFIVSSFGSA